MRGHQLNKKSYVIANVAKLYDPVEWTTPHQTHHIKLEFVITHHVCMLLSFGVIGRGKLAGSGAARRVLISDT